MKHSVQHDLGLDLAKQVAVKALESYQKRFADYRPQATWTSDTHADISFSIKGVTLRGTIDVAPSTIDLDLNVPFIFRPFKSTALGHIEKAITKWIDKAKAGTL